MAEAEPSQARLKRRLDLVRAHVDCENRHDFDGILKTFGTTVACEDQAWRERYPGSDGIRTYSQEFLQACDDSFSDRPERTRGAPSGCVLGATHRRPAWTPAR